MTPEPVCPEGRKPHREKIKDMTWQMRLPGVWVFGEAVRGVVRESIAEVGAVPSRLGGGAEWAWGVSVKAAAESKDEAVGPLSGREKRFGDAVEQAEAALHRVGVLL